MPSTSQPPSLLLDSLELLSLLFAGPGKDCVPLVMEELPAFNLDLERAAPGLPPRLCKALRGVVTAWTALPAGSSPESWCAELESACVALFVNTRGGAAAPPYASVYEPESRGMKGAAYLAMQQRLREQGLEPDAAGEPADHLSVQLEYLRHVLAQGETGEVRELAAEMLDWTGRFLAALERGRPSPPFARAGDALTAVLAYLAESGGEASEAPPSSHHS